MKPFLATLACPALAMLALVVAIHAAQGPAMIEKPQLASFAATPLRRWTP